MKNESNLGRFIRTKYVLYKKPHPISLLQCSIQYWQQLEAVMAEIVKKLKPGGMQFFIVFWCFWFVVAKEKHTELVEYCSSV
mgnify:CR=1 FL=1